MREYDVVIVGAGPAGCVTAAALDPRRSGLRTLILDCRRVVGVPVQDGEGLPDYGELRRIIPQVDCEELFDFPAGIVRHRIEGMKFVAPSGKAYVGDLKGWTIDRDRLDQHFAAQAMERGAELQLSTRVVKVEDGAVWTAGEQIRARWLVGADGSNSVVAASIPGLRPNRAMCRCSFVLAEGDFQEDLIELWFGREWKGGYFWLFPKGTQANIGLGCAGRPILDSSLMRPWHASPGAGRFASAFEAVELCRWAVSSGGWPASAWRSSATPRAWSFRATAGGLHARCWPERSSEKHSERGARLATTNDVSAPCSHGLSPDPSPCAAFSTRRSTTTAFSIS